MSAEPIDFTRLVPEIAEWNHGEGVDIETWIRVTGSIEHAIGYAQIFWPVFTLFDDCLLFAPVNQQTYREWHHQLQGNKTAIERVMNHRHINDIFQDGPTKHQAVYFANLLQQMWQAKLMRDFPSREVMVEIYNDYGEDDEELYDYQITIAQKRDVG